MGLPIVEFVFMGSFYGFQKWVSTDIFWIEHDSLELHATHYFHATSYLDLSPMVLKKQVTLILLYYYSYIMVYRIHS